MLINTLIDEADMTGISRKELAARTALFEGVGIIAHDIRSVMYRQMFFTKGVKDRVLLEVIGGVTQKAPVL